MSAAPILETLGLTCRFGGVTAVDNVDLTIAEGELRCLIGPNGAGKSTLFKCMTRQRAPPEAIFCCGAEVSSARIRTRSPEWVSRSKIRSPASIAG
jgi:branched-chain amino acid transport system ATP-binding protein